MSSSSFNLAGSKFPFVNMQGTNQQQQNNWPMHMNFQNNQNNSDGFSHQPNSHNKAGGNLYSFGNSSSALLYISSIFNSNIESSVY